jgi:tetratricopeptide (TPR) repeat protein
MMTITRRRLWLGLMGMAVAAGLSCSAQKPDWLTRFKELKGARDDWSELDHNVSALNHFARAQQLASDSQPKEAVAELKAALKDDPGSAYLRLVLADLLYQMDDLNEAIGYADEAVKLAPNDPLIHNLRGQVLLGLKRTDEGVAELRAAAEGDPNNFEFIANLAQGLMITKQPKDALTLLNNFAQNHPGDPNALFMIGLIFQSMGDLDQAIANYQYVVRKLDPSHYTALTNLLELYVAKGRLAEALLTARQLVEYYPQDPKSRSALVDLLLHFGKRDEALAVIDAGKTQGEPGPQWWVRKGYLLLAGGDPDGAQAEFEGALKAEPDNAEAAYGLGIIAERRGDDAAAAASLGPIGKDQKIYPDSRHQLALIALRRGDGDGAAAIMEKLVKDRPDSAEAITAYSGVMRDLGRYDQAEKVLGAALRKNPDNNPLNYEKAMLEYEQGHADAAIAVMRKVLDRESDNPQAMNFIGYTYAEQGIKLDEAEQLIRKALELNPDAGYMMDSLGWVYYQRGDYAQAIEWINKARRSEGDDPEILEHLADCHLALKDTVQARELYEKAAKTATSIRVKKRIQTKLEGIK